MTARIFRPVRMPASRAAGEHHRRDYHRRRSAADEQRNGRTGDRACVELAFAADVEQPHTEGDRGREAREGERRRRNEGVAERTVAEERGVEEPSERV